MLKIIGLLNLIISAPLWFICIKDWTSEACKAGLIAWFIKFPAILFTVIGIICFIIEAFIK